MDYENEVDAFQSLWADFYREAPLEFIREMINHGYDGCVIDKYEGSKHYVMYSPGYIRILNRHQRGQ